MSLPRSKAALARALSAIERAPEDPDAVALLDEAYRRPRAHVVGITGPPGVGKSTLTGALASAWRAESRTVGVVAVDPSSRRTGGALLGDRTRIRTDPADEGVFVRSMAAGERLGGLAALTIAAAVLMRAIYDVVVVETVGVGQSETDVAMIADTFVFCLQPGSGDSLQYMKAGIAEVPDIVVVTKADLGKIAGRARSDAEGALGLAASGREGWHVPVLALSAASGAGLEDLRAAIAGHWKHLRDGNRLEHRRAAQARAWLADAIRDRFGRDGLDRAGDLGAAAAAPFRHLAECVARVRD